MGSRGCKGGDEDEDEDEDDDGDEGEDGDDDVDGREKGLFVLRGDSNHSSPCTRPPWGGLCSSCLGLWCLSRC